MDATNNRISAADLSGWADFARECKAGWGRVFIRDVYRVAVLSGFEGTLEQFKTALVVSVETRSLLRRLDLTAALDLQAQAESAVRYMGATFHAVVKG